MKNSFMFGNISVFVNINGFLTLWFWCMGSLFPVLLLSNCMLIMFIVACIILYHFILLIIWLITCLRVHFYMAY